MGLSMTAKIIDMNKWKDGVWRAKQEPVVESGTVSKITANPSKDDGSLDKLIGDLEVKRLKEGMETLYGPDAIDLIKKELDELEGV